MSCTTQSGPVTQNQLNALASSVGFSCPAGFVVTGPGTTYSGGYCVPSVSELFCFNNETGRTLAEASQNSMAPFAYIAAVAALLMFPGWTKLIAVPLALTGINLSLKGGGF